MWDDPNAALARHQHRQAARQRRRDSQREDLLAAARVLIPEHGIAIALARIAVHAGLSRQAAAALFNATTDLATTLVIRAWQALIEATAPAEAATTQDFVVRLIRAIRDDAAAHRIHQALCCGTPLWQRQALADAEASLALALGHAQRATAPALPQNATAALGRRLLALARDAALAADVPDVTAEAACITAMLGTAAAPAPQAEPHLTAARHQPLPAPSARHPNRPGRWPTPIWPTTHWPAPSQDHAAPRHAAAAPPARVHDPPAHAA